MTDLIFHIGFSKCASTTLQKKVFLTDPGYIGVYHSDIKGRIDYAKQFQNFSPLGVKINGNIRQAKKWKHTVLAYKKSHAPHVNRLIASSEFFTQNNKLRNRPITKFLKRFNDDIWDEGNVKVVVVIRNQAEKIASGYAQDSNTTPHASQADFVRYTNRYLKKHGHLMDYSAWVEELQEAFGKGNLQVLLMEDIGNIDFWLKIKSFCDLQELKPESMLNNEGENVKKMGKYRWAIQPFNSAFKAKVIANNILKLVWPHHIKQDLRESTRLTFIKLITNYYQSRFYGSNSVKREDQIVLTESLQEQIKEHYRSSNLRLSELLDRDLTKLGY